VAIETSKRDPIRVEAAEGEVPTDKAVVAQAPVVAPGDRRKAPPRLRRPSAHRDPSLAFTGPVRVRLQRINCDAAKPYPPQGVTREWWQRLKDALGTASNAFVHSSLIQLIEAARLPRAACTRARPGRCGRAAVLSNCDHPGGVRKNHNDLRVYALSKVLKNIKLSRWPRNTGVFARAPVARKARETEQRSLARGSNAKPSPRPERRMPISRRSTICYRSSETRRFRAGSRLFLWASHR
jgi:hypothetical protein